MEGKHNKEEKTREVADIKMFILSRCLTTLSTCELVVYDTVDGEDNKEEKTREVANIIRMYNCSWNFLQLGHDLLW